MEDVLLFRLGKINIIGLGINDATLLQGNSHHLVERPLRTSFHRRCKQAWQIDIRFLLSFRTHPSSLGITRSFLIVATLLRQTIIVDAIVEPTLHLLLTTVSMGDLKQVRLFDTLTLEDLESLVCQFCSDGTAHIPVLLTLVLMEHTDYATVLLLSQSHEFLHNERSLHGIVDVRHEVLYTINNGNIGLNGTNGHFDHLSTFLETQATQIESVKRII